MCEIFIGLKCMSRLIYIASYEVILKIVFPSKNKLDPDFFLASSFKCHVFVFFSD